MRTALCDRLGIEQPIVGFTPSEHVAAAISRAGGLGVLGCVRFNDADELDSVLDWMDENTGGKPYGVDVVMPSKIPTEGDSIDLNEMIPQEHRDFVNRTLSDLGVPELSEEDETVSGVLGWLHSVARAHVDVLATGGGFVTGIETEAVGLAAVALGAGRQRTDSRIDPAVGFTLLRKVGEPVQPGEPVARIHYNDPGPVKDVEERLRAAFQFGPQPPAPLPLVLERLA